MSRILVTFLCAAIVFGSASSIGRAETPPNIILILVDDLGWSDPSCYGHEFHETPHLDAMAAEGVRWTDFYAAAPVCSPTRASVMSGLSPARLGLTDFVPGHWRPFEDLVVPEVAPRLEPSVTTIAELVKSAGYRSGYFGKWHLGGTGALPSDQGFDVSVVTHGGHTAGRFRTQPRQAVPEDTPLATFLTDQLLSFVDQEVEGPFLGVLAHYAVHIPIDPQPAKVAKFAAKEGANSHHTGYAALLEEVDDSLGRVLSHLKERGLDQDTVVIFTSDNGGLHRIFGEVGERYTNNAPLRGEKGTLYEGGIRVPCVVRWPGQIPAGTVCSTVASTTDLWPTLADLAQLDLPGDTTLDGVSLGSCLRDPSTGIDRAVAFHYPHYHHAEPMGAIRRGPWKLLEHFEDGRLELFDVVEDVGETTDMAAEHPEVVEQLHRELVAWRERVGAKMPTANPQRDASRAHEWWSRRRGSPLDLGGLERNYRTKVGARAAKESKTKQPNVLLIIGDDQHWGDYGFMGHETIKTPRLDRLARQSVFFPRGYVPSSLCCPSLATMVTGLFPHQHRITGNEPPRADKPPRPEYRARNERMDALLDEVTTLPTLLGQHGYLSHQSGKWWLGSYARGGFTHGMTHGDPERGGRHGDDGLKIGREGLGPIADFLDHAKREERPFFLWYAPFLPHTPHNPPERLLARHRDKGVTLPIAKYRAMCEWFDETCGQLLDLLRVRGLREDTVVLFVCDNGWINQQERSRYAPRSKRSPYEGGIRTPILVQMPGQREGRKVDVPVSSIDLFPTILAACGVERPDGLPGIDLLEESAVAGRPRIFGEIFEHDAVELERPAANLRYRYCIEGRWKLIVPAPDRVPDGEIELFDLVADPAERASKVAEHPELVRRLTAEIDRWWKPE